MEFDDLDTYNRDNGDTIHDMYVDSDYEINTDELPEVFDEAFTRVELDNLCINPRPLLPPPAVRTVSLGYVEKNDVFMLMMEQFDNKAARFQSDGKVALPVKYTPDGMELLANATNIGSVLFHKRHITGQHFYKLRESVKFVPNDQIFQDYYITNNNPKHPDPDEPVVFLYALLEIDMTNELDSTALNCQNKPFSDKTERYDSQYSTRHDLSIKAE